MNFVVKKHFSEAKQWNYALLEEVQFENWEVMFPGQSLLGTRQNTDEKRSRLSGIRIG